MNAVQPVSTPLRDVWARNGWVLIPGFIRGEELAEVQLAGDRLWEHQDLFGSRGAVLNSARRSDRMDPFIDVSETFAALSRDPRLLAVVSEVLGGEPQLMKDKFIAKPGGSGGYGAHQDAAYWQGIDLDFDVVLTATLFLDDATADNGAMECASGQHHALLTEPGQVADPEEHLIKPFTMIEAKAGDLLLLHSLTPHRSGTNNTDGMRRAAHFTFAVDPVPDLYARYKQFTNPSRS